MKRFLKRMALKYALRGSSEELRSFLPNTGGISLHDPQAFTLLFGGGNGKTTPVSDRQAMALSAVYACVGIKARTVATIPFKLFRYKEGWGRESARENSLYTLLHDSPNPYMTSDVFRRYMMECKEIRGNAFAYIERDPRGAPVALWPWHPDHVRIERVERELWYWLGNNKVPAPMRDVWHWRGRTLDGVVGLSPIVELMEMFGGALAAQRFAAKFWENGAMPGMALKHPGKMNAEARASLRNEFEELYGGKNVHRPALLQEGMELQQISLPQDHAQFLETRKFSVEEICRVFAVPPHMVQHLEKATFCLPGDAQVYTSEGPKPIESIKAGEMVWSYDNQGICLSRVKASVCSGDDELIEIRSTNRKLRCNAGHRVLVRRKHHAPKPGQGGYQNLEWRNEYIPAGELQVGDTLVVLDGLPDQGGNRCPTRKVSVGFMEFCGLLLGDGNVDRKAGVRIARADDALYMDYYRNVMQAEFVSYSGHGNGRTRNVPTTPVKIRECERSTNFSSVLAAEELEELGFCGNAYTKQVPEWVFSLNETLRLAFLRGYLDADGSVDKKGRISFHSVSRKMLTQMWHLCVGLGIPVTSFRAQDINTTLPNGKKIQSLIYTFTCSDPGSNRRIGSHDPRYVERLASGKPFQRKARNYPRYGGKDFDTAHCSISRISSIQKLPREAVYDLQVEETESFIADGVVVHNSNIEHQSIDFVTHCIRPEVVHIEQTANQRLLTPEERKQYFIEFELDGLLRGDYPTRMQGHVHAVSNGIMTRNTVAQIENLPPLPEEIGDMYTVQLAMTDMRSLATPEGPGSTPTPPEDDPEGIEGDSPEGPDKKKREAPRGSGESREAQRAGMEQRSRARRKLRDRFQKVFKEAAQRMIKREAQQIRKAMKQYLRREGRSAETRDAQVNEFFAWLVDWREEHREFAEKTLAPSFTTLGELIGEAAAGEVDAEIPYWMSNFLDQYAEAFGKRRAGYVENRLRNLLENVEAGLEADAVDAELDHWELRNAERVAQEETVKLSGAVQRAIWDENGYGSEWIMAGSQTCQICQEMNGKVVGRGQSFLPKGGRLLDLVVRSSVGHPPLHEGCECDIAPAR